MKTKNTQVTEMRGEARRIISEEMTKAMARAIQQFADELKRTLAEA